MRVALLQLRACLLVKSTFDFQLDFHDIMVIMITLQYFSFRDGTSARTTVLDFSSWILP